MWICSSAVVVIAGTVFVGSYGELKDLRVLVHVPIKERGLLPVDFLKHGHANPDAVEALYDNDPTLWHA